MLNLRTALEQNKTNSMLSLRSALSTKRSSLTELLQTNLIHQHYLNAGGPNGRFGFPTSEVQISGTTASRQYRGGEIQLLREKIPALPRQVVSVRFLGFKCVRESDSDQLSPHDEPYFVIVVNNGTGAPVVKKFGKFEGIDTDDEIGIVELLIGGVAPNPMSILALAYEQDDGDPDETAKKIQDEVVKLSQAAGSLASGAEAADGPGVGLAAGAATVGGIAAGPLGALAAAGIVSVLGLGDDFVGQSASLLFARQEDVGTPPKQGQFQGNDFNHKININGDEEGEYDLFFDVLVERINPSTTEGGG
jgi:hypothetical protein